MIETEEVIEFFDRLAPSWDDDLIRAVRALLGQTLENAMN